MPMRLDALDLLITALATWQAIEVWHHGSIFAGIRARYELEDDFFSRLYQCPFCFSVWLAPFAVFVIILPLRLPGDDWPGACRLVWVMLVFIAKLFVYALAVARLANLGNDLTYKWCRTPRPETELPEHGPEDTGPKTV